MTFFRILTTMSAGSSPTSNVAADVNGDGHLDLLYTSNNTTNLTLLLGDGNGGFTTSLVALPDFSSQIVLGDLDKNGHVDFVISKSGGDDVTVVLNDGSGVLSTTTVPIGNDTRGLAIGDLNGDGHLDFVVADRNLNTLSVVLNNGDGTFAAATSLPTGGIDSRETVAADLDGDGDLDVAVTNQDSDTVSILLNNGNGTFAAVTTAPAGDGPEGLAAGDIDGDGDKDLLVTNSVGGTVSILRNDGHGVFIQDTIVQVGDIPVGIEIGDLDADGDLDMVVANLGSDTISTLLNNGDGTAFTAAGGSPYPVGVFPYSVALGDYDEDGDLDIATAGTGHTTTIMLNASSNYSVSAAASANEGASGGGGELVYTISRTATSEAENVTYTLGGTAASTDYTAPSGTVSFAAGETTRQVRITIVGDRRIEGDETVVLTLNGTSGEGVISQTAGSGSATILNDDQFIPPTNAAPVLSAANSDAALQSGRILSLAIGDGHFTDPNGDDLDYTITVNGEPPPSWMTFDTETGALGGLPATAGVYAITVTASDGVLTVSDELVLTLTAPANTRGTKADETIVGDDLDNMVDGRKGDDRVTGGIGADNFVFGRNYGRDVVTDFNPGEGDKIDVSGAVGIKGFQDLIENHAIDIGDHVKIVADDGSILVIKRFELENVTPDMFIF